MGQFVTVRLTLIVPHKWFEGVILAYMDGNAKAFLIVHHPCSVMSKLAGSQYYAKDKTIVKMVIHVGIECVNFQGLASLRGIVMMVIFV